MSYISRVRRSIQAFIRKNDISNYEKINNKNYNYSNRYRSNYSIFTSCNFY